MSSFSVHLPKKLLERLDKIIVKETIPPNKITRNSFINNMIEIFIKHKENHE